MLRSRAIAEIGIGFIPEVEIASFNLDDMSVCVTSFIDRRGDASVHDLSRSAAARPAR